MNVTLFVRIVPGVYIRQTVRYHTVLLRTLFVFLAYHPVNLRIPLPPIPPSPIYIAKTELALCTACVYDELARGPWPVGQRVVQIREFTGPKGRATPRANRTIRREDGIIATTAWAS